jgi:dTDP-4-dehydrorhamnose reductase
VWITGAAGLIGSHLVNTAPRFAPQWNIRPLTRHGVDLLNFPAVREMFRREAPAGVIHCAALSQSTDCQRDPALARRINADATAYLAELAADIPFVFFSTDLVFDGRKGNYVESDRVGPLNVYAETKVAAEKVVLANPKHTVVRTSLNCGRSPSGQRGLDEQLRNAFEHGTTLHLFEDEFRSPIPVSATARAVWELVQWDQPGLYHLGGSERLSRWQIGQLVALRFPGLHPKLVRESLADYHGPPRPADTSLNSSRIQDLLSFRLPRLSEWLSAHD